MKQEQIVMVGKGGIGKSMISSHLSLIYANKGQRVLHVGCDPKRDSTHMIGPSRRLPSVVEKILSGEDVAIKDVLGKGVKGIHCIEAGGPQPGRGCAGRGISRTLELIEESGIIRNYSLIMFDLLGDVVCGGFAAPLRKGYAHKVVIATSDEWASLWAANNIARMVLEYADNGLCLAGLVLNSRMNREPDVARVTRFAKKLHSHILEVLPWDPALEAAEIAGKSVLGRGKASPLAVSLTALADKLLGIEPSKQLLPRPLNEAQLMAVMRPRR